MRPATVVPPCADLLYAPRMTEKSPFSPAAGGSPRIQSVPVDGAGYRFELMETFVRIVEAGSLSAAAAQLHTTQPTISRRLQALERSLGMRLLQRTTHTMRLTVDGERCFKRAKELLANWAAFEADLRGAQEEPDGLLRVAVPHAFGRSVSSSRSRGSCATIRACRSSGCCRTTCGISSAAALIARSRWVSRPIRPWSRSGCRRCRASWSPRRPC